MYSLTCLPSSSSPSEPTHLLTSWTKIGFVENRSVLFHLFEKLHSLLRLSFLHIFCKLLISSKNVQFAVCLVVIAAISIATDGRLCQSTQARVLPVSSYVWNSGAFLLPVTSDPDQTDSHMCKGSKMILLCQSLNHGMIAMKRAQQDRNQWELWLQLTCELSLTGNNMFPILYDIEVQ